MYSHHHAGCTKPLRLLYVIDVSEGMGRGTQRLRRWSRLKDFIDNINVNLLAGVEHQYMVYNVEPRILGSLDKCDRSTELFTIADDCLCNSRYQMVTPPADGSGCSVNQPTRQEDLDDWGKRGPRAGKALQRAKQVYFNKDNDKYKNVILLLSHKQSADDIERIERNLKASGISLIDIELGQRHDLRKKKSEIPHPPPSAANGGNPHQRIHKRSVMVPAHHEDVLRTIDALNNFRKTGGRLMLTTRKRNIIVPRKRAFIPIPQPDYHQKKNEVAMDDAISSSLLVNDISPIRKSLVTPRNERITPTTTSSSKRDGKAVITSTKNDENKENIQQRKTKKPTSEKRRKHIISTTAKHSTTSQQKQTTNSISKSSVSSTLRAESGNSKSTLGGRRRDEILEQRQKGVVAAEKNTNIKTASPGGAGVLEEANQDAHKVKVSLKKLTQTVKHIIGKVCTSNSDEDLNIRKKRRRRSPTTVELLLYDD